MPQKFSCQSNNRPILTGFSQICLKVKTLGECSAIAKAAGHRKLEETHMRAELLTFRKYLIYWYLRLKRIVRLHIESSMRLSRDEADAFVTKLKQTSSDKALPQIKDGQQRKIINLKRTSAAQKTIKDLPLLLANPQEHWFENNKEGLTPGLRKSSSSYHRLQALASQLSQEALHEVDRPSETAGEH